MNPLEGYSGIEPIDIVVDENMPTEHVETLGNVYTADVNNERIEGSMLLTKVDMYTKEPIAGVEFEIECIEGFMAGQKFSLVTNENGQANLDNLEYGKYRITEVKTGEEYVLNTEHKYFDIKTNGEVVEVAYENKVKEGYIEIEKKDSDSKKPLEGVEFTIYNSQDEVVGVYTTDKDGKFKSDKLVYGKYKLKETKVLENYIDNSLEIDFEILNDGETITQVIENDPMKGDLFFQKVDSKTKEVLAGAKMKLVGTDDINKHIEIEFESSKEGNEFRLPVGSYEITEESSPEGYIKSILPKKIEIKDGERLELNFENTKKPTSLGDILNKPQTGDSIIMYTVSTVISLIALIVLNKDKFTKKSWERYKRD